MFGYARKLFCKRVGDNDGMHGWLMDEDTYFYWLLLALDTEVEGWGRRGWGGWWRRGRGGLAAVYLLHTRCSGEGDYVVKSMDFKAIRTDGTCM